MQIVSNKETLLNTLYGITFGFLEAHVENVSLGTKGDCFDQELVRVIPVDPVIRLGYVICFKPRCGEKPLPKSSS